MSCTPSAPCRTPGCIFCDPTGEAKPDLLAGIHDGAWLDAQVFPPLRYSVPGLIPEGSVLLVGPPKIGKSWFVLSAGLAVAAGGRMLGIRVGDPRPVLLLALEDGDRRLQDRCRKLLLGDPIPRRFQYITRTTPGRVLDTVAAWLDGYGSDAPLVILDTLGKVMPPAIIGESAYQRDYRIGSAIKRLADEHPGGTLLTNHHDRKAGSEDFVDSVSGTHGLAGSADTIVVLSRRRNEDDGLLMVTGRDVPEGEYAVRFADGSVWTLDGEDLDEAASRARVTRAAAGLGDLSARIVAAVNARPEGARAADIAAALDMKSDTVKDYLSRLERAGRIARWARGVYGPTQNAVACVASVASDDMNATEATHATPLLGDET